MSKFLAVEFYGPESEAKCKELQVELAWSLFEKERTRPFSGARISICDTTTTPISPADSAIGIEAKR